VRKLIIHDLRLLSRRDRTARLIEFNPNATVIKGANDTGKSSLIKSIYWCFGADPAIVNDDWKALDICGALHFSVDGQHYTIVRHSTRFGIFDADEFLIRSFSSLTHDLGPYIADLMDFGLLLTSRDGEPQTPPPAYYLLPFYIDQDAGWKDTWCSFGNLSQYSNWKKDVAEYHVGIYDNKYYDLKTKLASVKTTIEEPRFQERSLRNAVEQIRNRLASIPVYLDVERFQQEVDELVSIASDLADEEEMYRCKVSELSNQRVTLNHIREIAQRILSELSADWEFTQSQQRELECPTCGAIYENALLERFGLAFDQDYCKHTIADTQVKLSQIEGQLSEYRRSMTTASRRHTRVWDLLEEKRGALSIHEIIMGEARGQAVGALQEEIDSIQQTVADIERQISSLKEQLADYEDRNRRSFLKGSFNDLLRQYSVELNVPVVGPLRSFASKINQTGSDLPRAVLAYSFAVLQMIAACAQSVFAPVVIDSPNQQDQDHANLKTMLEFINRNQCPDSQLILALVDPQGVDFGGKEIELTESRGVLDKGLYDSVGREIEDLLVRMSLQ